GLGVDTDKPRWAAEGLRPWTEDPVVIYRAGAVVRGTGFESKVAEEISSIKGRVRATFKKGTGVGVPPLAGPGAVWWPDGSRSARSRSGRPSPSPAPGGASPLPRARGRRAPRRPRP